MKLCIIASGDFFSTYGGGQVYVKNLVDEIINQEEHNHIQLSVISGFNNQHESWTFREYRGIKVYTIREESCFIQLLRELHPDVVHANDMYEQSTFACHELGIRCVVTIHDSRIVCPNVTYHNTHEELCSQQATVSNCLRCELNRIRCGKYAYPIMKHIPEKMYIKWGEYLQRHRFCFYITPVGEAAVKIRQKVNTWKAIASQADRVIELSERMGEMALLNGLSKEKLIILPNGIPIPETTIISHEITHPIKFFYFGRISRPKGIHVLLSSFSSIDNTDIELHIIGQGENEHDAKFMSIMQQKYHKDNRIIWHGKVDHDRISELIKKYDVLIHPSIANEACPLTIAEALALNKWTIATKCGGPEMQIIDNKNGWLIAPNNVQDMRNAILRYTKTPLLPQIKMVVSMDKHVQQLYSIYLSMLSK